MTFRPHTTHSLTHKKLTMAIANKHKKVQRTKMFTLDVDPEKLKQDAEKVCIVAFIFEVDLVGRVG